MSTEAQGQKTLDDCVDTVVGCQPTLNTIDDKLHYHPLRQSHLAITQ
jgi:hypothetical protein